MRPDRGAYQRSDLDRLGVSGGRPHAACPLWARWNDELGQRYSLGLEEEVMLLSPTDWALAQASDRVLEQLSDELSSRTFPEAHAAVIELATGIHPDVHGVVAELASLRNQLVHELGQMGLIVAAAGTHPLTIGIEPRCRAPRAIARSVPRCACSRGASRRWHCTCTSACRRARTRSGC